jgi:uncharacterized membrane protein
VIEVLVVAAIVGAGLMAGLLFAFSSFVMRALTQLPAEYGMRAMQRINVEIINPLFLLVFLGTAALCAAVGALAWRALPAPAAGWWLLGALAYLAGPFAITLLFNVPLNNRLAGAAAERAAEVWPDYVRRWLGWNHLRTLLAVVAVACLAVGLALSAGASG